MKNIFRPPRGKGQFGTHQCGPVVIGEKRIKLESDVFMNKGERERQREAYFISRTVTLILNVTLISYAIKYLVIKLCYIYRVRYVGEHLPDDIWERELPQ